MADERCDVCDSARHVGECTGFPGAIYAHYGHGWYPWGMAHELEKDTIEVEWDTVWSYSMYGLTPVPRVVVVDTETSGLNPKQNEMLEVAWFDTGHIAGTQNAIVPHTLADFSREALEINRYRERGLGEMERWCEPQRLAPVLAATFEGAHIGGSNTAFDKDFLTAWAAEYSDYGIATWAHQPVEIGSVVMGYLGRSIPLRLKEIPEALGLTVWPDHTAKGDVWVVVQALRAMQAQS
jgi:hypothetical protein